MTAERILMLAHERALENEIRAITYLEGNPSDDYWSEQLIRAKEDVAFLKRALKEFRKGNKEI